jgi:predicted P-loop ATPase
VDHLPPLGDKEAQIQLGGKAIVEDAEFDSMSKAEAGRLKAFATIQVDRYRAPWDKIPKGHPRRCVLCATTNKTEYLTDSTGGRRFWPVRVGKIDLEWLRENRDQLWAEAVVRFKAGERWWLTAEEEKLAREQQAERYESDVWTEKVLQWCDNPEPMGEDGDADAEFYSTRDQVLIDEVLRHGLGMHTASQRSSEAKRITAILTGAGWQRARVYLAGHRARVYQRPGVLPGALTEQPKPKMKKPDDPFPESLMAGEAIQ